MLSFCLCCCRCCFWRKDEYEERHSKFSYNRIIPQTATPGCLTPQMTDSYSTYTTEFGSRRHIPHVYLGKSTRTASVTTTSIIPASSSLLSPVRQEQPSDAKEMLPCSEIQFEIDSTIDWGAIPEQKTSPYSWKIHVSLDATQANIEKGWNIVKDILIKYSIGKAKVVTPYAATPDTKACDAGKQITIYVSTEEESSINWQNVFYEIEILLAKHGVQPSPIKSSVCKPTSCKSRYTSYRHDQKPPQLNSSYNTPGTSLDYFSTENVETACRLKQIKYPHNPANVPDPFQSSCANRLCCCC